jgi:hypothetical protein
MTVQGLVGWKFSIQPGLVLEKGRIDHCIVQLEGIPGLAFAACLGQYWSWRLQESSLGEEDCPGRDLTRFDSDVEGWLRANPTPHLAYLALSMIASSNFQPAPNPPIHPVL